MQWSERFLGQCIWFCDYPNKNFILFLNVFLSLQSSFYLAHSISQKGGAVHDTKMKGQIFFISTHGTLLVVFIMLSFLSVLAYRKLTSYGVYLEYSIAAVYRSCRQKLVKFQFTYLVVIICIILNSPRELQLQVDWAQPFMVIGS